MFVLILTNGGESADHLMGGLAGGSKDTTANEGMSPEEGEVARVEASGHSIHTFLCVFISVRVCLSPLKVAAPSRGGRARLCVRCLKARLHVAR